MKQLIEKREELAAKNAVLAGVFEQAGSEMDLKKVKTFGTEDVSTLTTADKADKIAKANDELTALGIEVDQLIAVDAASANVKRIEGLQKPAGIKHAAPGGNEKPYELKTLGRLIGESPGFKQWVEDRKAGSRAAFTADFDTFPSHILAAQQLKQSGGLLAKTLFETSAGWAGESTRIGRLIDEPTRPIELLDIIPMEQTGQPAVVYMEETTRTHSAAETDEGAAYPESAFVVAEQTSTVRKIADSIPVTDEQLEDVPAVEGYLTNRLLFGVRQRLDTQVMSGDGVAPNLAGILNVAGIQTQALGGDPRPDAFYKAMDLVKVTGRANPSGIAMHANDWQAIRLLRTADGIYIWGAPSEAGPSRMWGLPVAVTSVSEGTGLVGDFRNFCAIFERRGVTIEVGYTGTQFVEGEKTIRAQMRAAFVTFRATAFCSVTGI